FLNLGVWLEKDARRGFNWLHRAPVMHRELARGIEQLNEYDLSDANFLLEWVHAAATKIIRLAMKTRETDQEIHVKIVPTERASTTHRASLIGSEPRNTLRRLA